MKLNKLRFPTLDDVILQELQRSDFPISLDELKHKTKEYRATTSRIRIAIDSLRERGYDIKTLVRGRKELFSLVRLGSHDLSAYYKPLGKVTLPILLSSDWHFGSIGFSEQAFRQLVKDVREYGIKHLIHCGDLIQGRGVHKREFADLLIPKIEEQERLIADKLNELPCKIHLTLGNHEEALLGDVRIGHNPLKYIANLCNNATYYGVAAKLKMGRAFSLLMMHSAGGFAYAYTYHLQKVWRSLIEEADILVLGHRHQLLPIPMPNHKLAIESGTLQRENSFLIWRGITPQVGWIVLEDFDGSLESMKICRPRVF